MVTIPVRLEVQPGQIYLADLGTAAAKSEDVQGTGPVVVLVPHLTGKPGAEIALVAPLVWNRPPEPRLQLPEGRWLGLDQLRTIRVDRLQVLTPQLPEIEKRALKNVLMVLHRTIGKAIKDTERRR